MMATTEQAPRPFSEKRKTHTFHLHCDWNRAKSGWKTVTGFTKNSLLILAFLVLLSAVMPTYIPGISNDRLESRVTVMEGRQDTASKDLEALRADMQYTKSVVADMKATQDKVLWVCVFFLLAQVAGKALGLNLKRGE